MHLSNVSLGLLLLAAACVDINNVPAPSEEAPASPLSMAGTWSHTANFSNRFLQIACTSTGTITFDQADSTITGGYDVVSFCTDTAGTAGGQSTGTFGGQIDGNVVSFVTDVGCSYSGSIADTTAEFVYGQGSCNFVIDGSPATFFGTWQAAKSSACPVGLVARREYEVVC